jgi:squalene-hopene/tetraprenyl-beta-curcumene cyclase
MKTTLFSGTIALLTGSALLAQTPSAYMSLQEEMKQAIARGNAWLASQQKTEGHWDDPQIPAFSALALSAATRDPNLANAKEKPAYVNKGFDWLRAQQKEDGGIYNRGLSVYNTATSLTALASAQNEGYEAAMVRARKYLINNQWDTGEKGKVDGANDGGVGYGSKNDRADMSNTYLAIEALTVSKKVIDDGKHGDQPDLDWGAAIEFLSRCQNLEQTNKSEWASNDPKNKGGFVYGPNESKVEDSTPLANGKVPLRSYGSMSYVGLLSMLYAKLSPDDQRVKAVKEWLGGNYTLEENPGLGGQGIYYYYNAMAKALAATGEDKLKLADGKEIDWRKELGEKLLTTQNADGSWKNSNGRWMESNPILTTAYTVMALEAIYYSIPQR